MASTKSTKSNGVDMADWARMPQQSSDPAWLRILKCIYDPEEKSFLGRTAKRWGIVLVFYLVFYAVLAVLFALCMCGLLYSLDEQRPTYLLEESLIGASPDLAFRPYPPAGEGTRPVDEFVWKYSRDDVKAQEVFKKSFEHFMSAKPLRPAQKGCSPEDNYGLPDSPCFIIKLNRIIGWEADVYKASELPPETPNDLQNYAAGLESPQVWVSCEVEDRDKDNATTVLFPWGQYLNDSITAIQIKPKENHLAKVRCRAWARNIEYNGSTKERRGYTRILLQIDGTMEGADAK